MAKLVNYVAQTGVNRGTGARNTVAIKEQTANKFGQMADMFANDTLQQLKKDGEKLGTDTALQTKFIDKEVLITNENGDQTYINVPVLPKTPNYLGKTASENYDKVVFKRYINEIQNDVTNIISEDYHRAKTKQLPPMVVENLLEEKKDLYIKNLPPKVGELISQHWQETFQKQGLGYLDIYGERIDKNNKEIFTNELTKENVFYNQQISAGNFNYKDDNLMLIYETGLNNNILDRERYPELLKEKKLKRTVTKDIFKKYYDYIGPTTDVYNVDDIATNQQKINNLKKIGSMLNPDGQTPASVTLKSNKGDIIVTAKDINELVQGNLINASETKTFIEKTSSTVKQLTDAQKRQITGQEQVNANASRTKSANGIYTQPLEYRMSVADLKNYMDTDDGKSQILNIVNTKRIENGETTFNESNLYKDHGALKIILADNGTLPDTVTDVYAEKVRSLNPEILTERDFELLLYPLSLNMDSFDYEINFGFNKKNAKRLENIMYEYNRDTNRPLAEVLFRVKNDENLDLKDRSRSIFESLYDTSAFRTPAEFSESVSKIVTKEINNHLDEEMLSIGKYYQNDIINLVYQEIASSSTQVLAEPQITNKVRLVLGKYSFTKKFGRDKATVGANTIIRKGQDFTKDSVAALPAGLIYTREGESLDNLQKNILRIISTERPMSQRSKDIFGNVASDKSFDRKLGIIPTNFNYLKDPNFVRNIENYDIARPSYYVVGYNVKTEQWEFLRDNNDEFYITKEEDFLEFTED